MNRFRSFFLTSFFTSCLFALCLQIAACGGGGSSSSGGGTGVTTTSLPAAKVGAPYSASLQVNGGTPPYIWTVQGTLPPGLTLASSGNISGTPHQAGVFGSLVFTATDSAGHTARSSGLSITVSSSLQVTTTSLPSTQVGMAYSASLEASGGTAPYTWAIQTGILGSIPPGVVLSGNGLLSGKATEPGVFGSLAFTVTDAKGLTGNSAVLSITVAPLPLGITTTTLQGADIGVPYAQFLVSSGGNPPLTWSIKSGTLPAGLTLNASSGGIKGTPTAQGTSTLVFQVTDSSNPAMVATSGSIALTVAQPLAVTTTSLPNGMVGSAYPAAALQATGGVAPYTWSFDPNSRGTFPDGLVLNADGTISGTPTNKAAGANNSLIFTVTDAAHATANSVNLSIFVTPLPLMITTTSLPNGQIGVLYQSGVTSTGGIPPFTWIVKSGSLPLGLALGMGGGGITGTPQGPAGSSTAVFQVTDSSSPAMVATSVPLTIQILPAPLSVTTTSLPNGTAGVPYSAALAASGGAPPYSWSFVPHTLVALPPGLVLNANGTIVGTPAEPIVRSGIQFQVTDSTNATGSAGLGIIINPGPLAITTTSLPNGTPGVPYNATLQGTGGEGLYTFTLKSGALPGGLTLNPGGSITGTPTVHGTFNSLTFELNDANGDPPATSQSLTINVALQALAVNTALLPNGTVTIPYSETLQASGGQLPYTWTQTAGTLPPGLSFSTAGVISGTPTAVGAASGLVFQVTDNTGTHTLSSSLTLDIPAVAVTTTSLPGAAQNVSYMATLQASYGKPPYLWAVSSGTLPTGLSLTPSNGVISGSPTVLSNGVQAPFQVTVTDATHTSNTSANLNIQVTGPIDECNSDPMSVAKLGNQPIAFLFSGFDATTNGTVAIAGSFTPNGTGTVVKGEEDINQASSVNGSINRAIVGGDYSVSSDGRGCLTLIDSAAVRTNFRFALGGFNSGTQNYTTGRIIEFDDKNGTGTRGSGIMRQQTTAAFGGLQGSYAFELSGTDATHGHYALGGFMHASGSANGGTISNVAADADDSGALSSALTGGNGYFGSTSAVDGRGTTAFAAGTVNAALVYYIVNDNEVILLSSDPVSGNPLSSGEAFLTGSAFSAADLNNYFIYHTLGVPGSVGSVATIGTVQFDGISAVSGAYSQDDAGNSLGPISITGAYTVDAGTGRVQFTGNFGSGSANSPVGYIVKGAGPNSVVLIGTDIPATSGLIEFQTNSLPVDLSGLAGPFSFATDENPDYVTANHSGNILFGSGLGFTGTEDDSYPPGNSEGSFLAANQAIFPDTASFGTNGVGTFGPNTVAVTNGTVIYYIPDSAPAIVDPTITTVVK